MKHFKLFILILLSVVSMSAKAIIIQSGKCGINLTWELTDEYTLVISGTGEMTPFSSVPWEDFSQSIKKVVIGESVTNIRSSAFYGCENLTSITIPNSVTSVGIRAFDGCKALTSITIPNSVTDIGYWTFKDCKSLTSITIPNSVTSIGNSAFGNCSGLSSVVIGNSVTNISVDAFEGCNNVKELVYADGCKTTLRTDLRSIERVTIPNSVTTIGEMSFYGCEQLSSVTIPDSVVDISASAFENCVALTSVTIPNSVQRIGWAAFDECENLSDLTLGNSVVDIDELAFSGCSSLKTITIPNSVKNIRVAAFENCKNLTSVIIGNSVETIGYNAFRWCPSLVEVTSRNKNVPVLDNWYLTFDVETFSNGTLYVPSESVEAYQKNDEWGRWKNIKPVNTILSGICGEHLTWELDATHSLKISGYGDMFDYESKRDIPWMQYASEIEELFIGDSVTSIGDSAFFYCTSLRVISIPHSVKTIGNYAFRDCYNLKSVSFGFDSSVTNIGDYAFSYCSQLSYIIIPNSVTHIGSGAFYRCSALVSVQLPSTLTEICPRTFYRCSSLKSISIPKSVIKIGNYSFQGCIELTSITIPENVTNIGDDAFSVCEKLTSVTCLASVPPTTWNSFPVYGTLHVPFGCKAAYQAANPWKNFDIIDDIIIDVKATSITLNHTSVDMQLGEELELAATVLPGNATNKEVQWTIADPNVAFFVSNGTLFAASTGTTTITATTTDGSNLSATCTITVVSEEDEEDTDIASLDNVIYINNMEAHAGESVLLSVNMKNAIDVQALQCNVCLPDGFEVTKVTRGQRLKVRNDDDEYVFTFNSSTHSDGSCFLLAYNTSDAYIDGNDGEISSIILNIPETITPGDYPIIIENAEISESDHGVELQKVKSTLKIIDYILGDANGDGRISIADVSTIASHLLGKAPANFVPKAADVNKDGRLSIVDVSALAKMLLDKNK